MTQFDDREKAFEKKFSLEEELKFKFAVRAAKLFGFWVAGHLGLPASEAETYAAQLCEIVVAKPGHDSILLKVEEDMRVKGLNMSRRALEKEFGVCQIATQRKALV